MSTGTSENEVLDWVMSWSLRQKMHWKSAEVIGDDLIMCRHDNCVHIIERKSCFKLKEWKKKGWGGVWGGRQLELTLVDLEKKGISIEGV